MIKKLEFDYQKPNTSPVNAIVAIHGWQGNRRSMQPLVSSLNFPDINWFFPEAPYSVNGVKSERSWSYEIKKGVWEIEEPRRLLKQFFNEIFQSFKPKQVFVMGFSQGGLVCLEHVLQMDTPLGGVFPIAGFLRDSGADIPRFHPGQKNTPILIGHGREDDVVPVRASEKAFKLLKAQGANVELLIYKGKHKIGVEYLRRMKEIIQS